MRLTIKPIAILLILSSSSLSVAEELAPISVTDTAIIESEPTISKGASSDVSTAMKQVPGGSVHGNGQISGQTYYRGLFGPRMNVLIDGRHIQSGGPNWMDPPLHYMPNALMESFEVQRGIDSVSNGSNSWRRWASGRRRTSRFMHAPPSWRPPAAQAFWRSPPERSGGLCRTRCARSR